MEKGNYMKPKMLINLQGYGGSGKTTILKELLRLLLNDPQMDMFETGTNEKVLQPVIDTNAQNFPYQKDDEVITVITMKTQIKDIKIGIATAGDIEDFVAFNMDFFMQHKCDIMICPTKLYGKTTNYILNLVQQNQDWVFLPFVTNWIEDEQTAKRHKNRLAEEIYATLKSRWNTITNQAVNIRLI